MKKLFIFLLIVKNFIVFSQNTNESIFSKKTIQLKANVLFIPVGMINLAVEKKISEKYSIQGEVFVSPWKSFLEKKLQFAILGLDGRYYISEVFRKWYVGANLSLAIYNMQKFNYWSDVPYQLTENSPIYITSDLYQKGFSVMAGAVLGYHWEISNHWNLDIYAGAGTIQSFYKGFHKDLGIRYDEQSGYNKSGEILPYKGGVMISYTLK